MAVIKTNSKKHKFHIAVSDDKGNLIMTVGAEADTVRNALAESARIVSRWTKTDPNEVDGIINGKAPK